eukprot:COSAG03_NODE_12826_length_529_cov_0.967442_2_plen_96_part_01
MTVRQQTSERQAGEGGEGTFSEHADGVAGFALQEKPNRTVVHKRLVHVHTAHVAVGILASIAAAALPLVYWKLHVVQIPPRHKLRARWAADRCVDE